MDVCAEKVFSETQVLKLNSEKARTRLQWDPVLEIDDALRWTCDWHDARMQQKNMAEFTMRQIREYELLRQSVLV